MQVLASQLHFLANRNGELAIPPLFWPVNCIKIGRHVALLSDPTVYSLYCDVHDQILELFPVNMSTMLALLLSSTNFSQQSSSINFLKFDPVLDQGLFI